MLGLMLMMETLLYYIGATEVETPAPTTTLDDVLKDVKRNGKEGLALRDMIKIFPETRGPIMEALVCLVEFVQRKDKFHTTTPEQFIVTTPQNCNLWSTKLLQM
jgi:hypothetical protein